VKNFRRIIKESAPILVLCILGELLAGVIMLTGLEDTYEVLPGLVILIPAVLALRGNISSAMGSRLGSAIHMGLVESKLSFSMFKNATIKENLYATTFLNFVMAVILGVFAYLIATASGVHASFIALMLICLLASLLSGFFLVFLTISLAVYVSSKGLDPDNVLIPLVATIGDIVTIIFLFVSAQFVLSIL
jgi:mgtE-like transporter